MLQVFDHNKRTGKFYFKYLHHFIVDLVEVFKEFLKAQNQKMYITFYHKSVSKGKQLLGDLPGSLPDWHEPKANF